MLAAPGCWSLHTGLEDWKIGLTGGSGIDTAQWMIDSYAVQHATNPDPRNRQSVAVHLMSLCAALEHDVPGAWPRRPARASAGRARRPTPGPRLAALLRGVSGRRGTYRLVHTCTSPGSRCG